VNSVAVNVRVRWLVIFAGFFILIWITGCASYPHVSYSQVTEANWVEVKITSGRTVAGTVLKAEPHQLILRQDDQRPLSIPKTVIRSIRRKPPVYDEFGRGIPEEDIRAVQTNRNTIIYGIGGGALGLGVSFFASSSLYQEDDSETVVPALTGAGTGLSVLLFTRAGRNRDRQEAVEIMRGRRRQEKVESIHQPKQSERDILRELEAEKIEQERLRKERERILRELQKRNNE